MSLKITIAAVVVLLFVFGGVFFLRSQQRSVSVSSVPANPFGQSAVPTNVPQGQTHGGTVEVKTGEGTLQTKDFTKSPDIATSSDSGAFYLSYPAAGDPEYEINYLPDHSFFIGIFKEPIGEIRRAMTSDLMARLGISQKELCSLSAYIAVPSWASEHYAGVNLGFPGCPNATVLPGD